MSPSTASCCTCRLTAHSETVGLLVVPSIQPLADTGMGAPGGCPPHGLVDVCMQQSQNTDTHMHNTNPTKR